MYTLLEDIARMYVQGAALPQLKAKEALVGLVNKWRGATCQNIYLPALLRTALRICSRRFWNAAGKPVLCQGRDPEAITVLALFQEDLFFTNVPQQVAIQQVQGPCAALDHMTRTSFSWRGLQGGEGMLEHGGNEAHTTRLNKREKSTGCLKNQWYSFFLVPAVEGQRIWCAGIRVSIFSRQFIKNDIHFF